jgi:hypothetical protein
MRTEYEAKLYSSRALLGTTLIQQTLSFYYAFWNRRFPHAASQLQKEENSHTSPLGEVMNQPCKKV